MTHALGCYYCPEHKLPVDLDYIAKLAPPVIRLLEPDVQHIADMHALCPNAIIAPRTWAIDDGSDEDHPSKQVNRLMADPVGTGRDHAAQYRGQLDRWKQEAHDRGLTLPLDDHIYFNSANEPNQGGTAEKIAAYSVAFLNRCTELNIRATAPCLGVGWPDNSGPDTPVNWQPYIDAGLEQAINRGQHWLDVHEYFYKTGPQDGWTWLAGRHLQCPLDVPILLGEIGCDNFVYNERWQKEPEETRGNRGWQGNVTPDQYAEMVEWHIRHSDTRVIAALLYLTDFRDNRWESFNTRAAHGALLARKDNMVPQATPNTPPVTIHLPAVGTGASTMYVNVPSGARVRDKPGIGAVLTAIPYGESITVLGLLDQNGQIWANVKTNSGIVGYSLAALLSLTQPVTTRIDPPAPVTGPGPTTPPIQAGDDWSRVWPITLNIEGGLSTDRSDPGNYRPNGEFVGTKFGISALAHPTLDIVNLTKEQALEIYRRDYWQGSGADKLPWPLNLLHFDAYVQNEVAAREFLAASRGNPNLYMAERIDWYTRISNWENNGKGWMRRCATILRQAAT